MELGGVGIWSGDFRAADPGEVAEAAAELEELGAGTLWFPGGMAGEELFDTADVLLRATRRVVVATGIVNVWTVEPDVAAARTAALVAEHGHRFLLGIGVGHAPAIERVQPGAWGHPVEKVAAYLDALDAAPTPVPQEERILAALGPRMLALAKERTAGSHPFLAPPSHTRLARAALGEGPLLAPDLAVVLDGVPTSARAVARAALAMTTKMPSYQANLLRSGLAPADLEGELSDELIDRVVVWGRVDAIAARVRAHHKAGADHVALRILGSPPGTLPRETWRKVLAGVVSPDGVVLGGGSGR